MAAQTEPRQSPNVLENHGALSESSNHTQKSPTTIMPKQVALSPSPILVEPRMSKDDSAVALPTTPKRPNISRGLSLQLPRQDVASPSASKLTNSLMSRVPLSPKLDSSTSASVLPRRSRGLDFSRACTNLHHSTLAESSPDSSPVIGKAMNIPRKSSGPDSPMCPGSLWSSTTERTAVSSSMGSVHMMDSISDTSDSDEDMFRGVEEEDAIHMTPQPLKAGFVPFPQDISSPGVNPMSSFSPTAASLMSFKRRFRSSGRTRSVRKGSSSTSLQSSLPSPGPLSPPLRNLDGSNASYFSKDIESSIESRRASLSLGTHDLRISDTMDGETMQPGDNSFDALGLPHPQVIRRPVTRRSDMLPKSKMFNRIRAALQEEVSPVDSECRREAEVIRQVRENDPSPESTIAPSQGAATAASSPDQTAGEDLHDIVGGEAARERRSSSSFTQQALRNSGGPDFWNSFDERIRTPPPPFPLRANSTVSDDIAMETPTSTIAPIPTYPSANYNSSPSRSSTPQPIPAVNTRKTLGKRRRDDDFDPALFKRRAVSPGVSLQNSPILPSSPAQREGGWWQTKAHRESSASSNSVSNGSMGKRVGMQGMNDTNDGLMNMSIE